MKPSNRYRTWKSYSISWEIKGTPTMPLLPPGNSRPYYEMMNHHNPLVRSYFLGRHPKTPMTFCLSKPGRMLSSPFQGISQIHSLYNGHSHTLTFGWTTGVRHQDWSCVESLAPHLCFLDISSISTLGNGKNYHVYRCVPKNLPPQLYLFMVRNIHWKTLCQYPTSVMHGQPLLLGYIIPAHGLLENTWP